MKYEDVLEFIHSRPRIPKVPSLDCMKKLMNKLGNPQNKLKFVHIAGTNGKGSCAAMLSNILKEAGYTVGLNISPYIITFCERIQVNGQMITKRELAKFGKIVMNASLEMKKNNEGTPKEFEIVTAIAFLYYEYKKCDIVCLEVGLGGRFDATNIISDTLVSCIMKIGLDHTSILGNTKKEIAFEKSGIIKEKSCVVNYPLQDKEVDLVISETAKKQKSKLITPQLEDIKRYKGDVLYNKINYGGYEVLLPFIGKHQALNASVVIETALYLDSVGYSISDDAIIDGIENTRFPSRIEIINNEPLIILDGCHNEDSVDALCDVLDKIKNKKIIAIIGMLSEKKPEYILEKFKKYFNKVYTVDINNPRAMKNKELYKIADNIFDSVIMANNLEVALKKAKKELNKDTMLCICGSLYLTSEIKKLITNKHLI